MEFQDHFDEPRGLGSLFIRMLELIIKLCSSLTELVFDVGKDI